MTNLSKIEIDESTGLPALPDDHHWEVKENIEIRYYGDEHKRGYLLNVILREEKIIEQVIDCGMWPWSKKKTIQVTDTVDTIAFSEKIRNMDAVASNDILWEKIDSSEENEDLDWWDKREKYNSTRAQTTLLNITPDDVYSNSLIAYASFLKKQEDDAAHEEHALLMAKKHEASQKLVGKYPPLSLKDA